MNQNAVCVLNIIHALGERVKCSVGQARGVQGKKQHYYCIMGPHHASSQNFILKNDHAIVFFSRVYLSISMQKHLPYRRRSFPRFYLFVYRGRGEKCSSPPMVLKINAISICIPCVRTHVYKNIENRLRRDERNLCSAVTLLSTINMFSYYNKQNK